MSQLKLIGILLTPSISSILGAMFLAGFVLAVSSWSAVTNNPMLHDYFFGPFGIIAVIGEAQTSLEAMTAALSAKPLVYNILIFVVAVLAGLVVFLILQGFTKLLSGFLGGVVSVQEATPDAKKLVQVEVGARFGVRTLTVIAWAAYGVFFLKILLPFSIMASYINANELITLEGWLYGLLGFVLLTAGMQLHVIFARLLMLRPRLFGMRNIILED
jgi:hypothetical protein